MSRKTQISFESDSALEAMEESDQPGFAAEGGGEASRSYNETAFRQLLAIERKRSERSGRFLRLMLVDLGGHTVPGDGKGSAVADKLFRGLSSCVRETDVVGWYREGQVAGAVIVDLADALGFDADRIAQRVHTALRGHLPSRVAVGLQVHVQPCVDGPAN